MASYETMFIVHPEATEEEVAVAIEKIKTAIEADGKVEKVDEWGKKKLAYEIDKVREGYYVVVTFDAQAAVLEQLNHIYRITENILRGIIIKLEK